jgi:hypothetical protein
MVNHVVVPKASHQYSQWTIGTQGNAWNNVNTKTGGFSNIIRTYGMPYLSIMGEIYADTTLSFYASQDGKHFYYCSIISTLINPTEPPAPDWASGILYLEGDEVTNGAVRYRCILAHTSNPSREPPNATYWEVVPATFPKQFHIYPQVGAEYVRLRSSNNVKAIVTVAAKRGA